LFLTIRESENFTPFFLNTGFNTKLDPSVPNTTIVFCAEITNNLEELKKVPIENL